MRGVSPIVSTILMVAIAIAAAVVVYYITMDVITKQGTQLEQQSQVGTASIRIEAANLNVSSTDSNTELNLAAGESFTIYYTILNGNSNNIADYVNNASEISVYIYDSGENLLCQVPGTNFNTATAGQLALSNSVTNCGPIDEGKYYYVKVTAGSMVSNLYKVKAQ